MPNTARTKLTKAQEHYREILQSRPSIVWKNFSDGHNLKLHLFFPSGHDEEQDIPSVVFFHGGMWMTDNIIDLIAWALQLNSIGVACLIPEYRTREQYDVRAQDILQDAQDMWQWISRNASVMGLDPTNITLAGADVGGLMALHAGMPVKQKRSFLDLFRKEYFQPHVPAALAIFRAVIDVSTPESQILNILEDMKDYESINPTNRLGENLPPIFIAHGAQDLLQDVETSDWFCHEWKHHKNKAEVFIHPTMDHTLMNFQVNPTAFEQMQISWHNFMLEIGLWQESTENNQALMA